MMKAAGTHRLPNMEFPDSIWLRAKHAVLNEIGWKTAIEPNALRQLVTRKAVEFMSRSGRPG